MNGTRLIIEMMKLKEGNTMLYCGVGCKFEIKRVPEINGGNLCTIFIDEYNYSPAHKFLSDKISNDNSTIQKSSKGVEDKMKKKTRKQTGVGDKSIREIMNNLHKTK